MAFFSNPADLVSRVERRRAVARLTRRLETASDRRLEDMGLARGDIADVAEAAYPRRHASAAADPTFRSRVALAGLRPR